MHEDGLINIQLGLQVVGREKERANERERKGGRGRGREEAREEFVNQTEHIWAQSGQD